VPIFLDTINEVDKRLILRYKHDVDEGSGQYGDNDEFFHDTDLVDTTTSNFPTRELPAFLEACRKAEVTSNYLFNIVLILNALVPG
jgi:hypothetical protein